jgi:hypothetical protein
MITIRRDLKEQLFARIEAEELEAVLAFDMRRRPGDSGSRLR